MICADVPLGLIETWDVLKYAKLLEKSVSEFD